jgi:lipopolysaccharide transport system ATP-binding protein
LLKILSRITEPTEGRVRIRGRVASLLEVGTGFHPELTGRENVFLNGAILGMSRAEIKGKFDEIVAFAEVEKFLDTPVKRYSSGMYVRLAFAVAAHLEPEILIVDEVLAVGDAQFQKKCLGRMHEVARAGRTVLFVSHNMGAINQLCTRAILLNHGKISSQGDPTEITSNYLRSENAQWSARDWPDVNTAPGDNVVRLVSVRVIHLNQTEIAGAIDVRQSVGIEILYLVIVDGAIFVPSLHLHNAEGTQLFLAIDLEKQWMRRPRRCGLYRSTTWIPGNFLNIGMHYASVAMSRLDTHRLHLFEQQVVAFNVVESSGGDTARGIYAGNLPGAIRPILEWETVTIQLSEVAETLPAGRQE